MSSLSTNGIGPKANGIHKTNSTSLVDLTNPIHDVVIIGAGPAGSMLASCLSRLGIKPIVFDCDPSPHEWGRGDALMPRTVEVLSQLGNGHPNTSVGDILLSRSTLINGLAGYSSQGANSLQPGIRQPMLQLLDVDQQCIYGVRQGVVEQTLLEDVGKTSLNGKEQIFRPFKFTSFDYDDQKLLKVHITNEKTGEQITVQSHFLIGADGGKSTVRKALLPLGVEFQGNTPEALWCAVDFVGVRTNYPDSRIYGLMDNSSGNLMLIPREPIHGKECFRLYIQIDALQDAGNGERLTRETVTFDHAIKAAKKVLHPYTLEWDEINWFTAYPVGQRLASTFDVNKRIFLMGDACHTHSPKGGLGMNTSMMDAYNLSWKLALVLKSVSPIELLSTYNKERRSVAEKLLEYDMAILKMFEQINGLEGVRKAKLAEQFEDLEKRNSLYHMGVGISYESNMAISKNVDPLFLGERSRIKVGSRILPSTIRRFRDLRVVNLLTELFFDLRFRVIVLIGDLTQEKNKASLKFLSDQLQGQNSFHNKKRIKIQTNTFDTFQNKPIERIADLLDFKTITTTSSCDPRLNFERIPDLAVLKGSPLFDDKNLYCDEVPALSGLDYLMFKGKWFPPERGQAPQVPPLEILPFQLHQRWDVDPVKGGVIVVARPDGHIAVATTFDVNTLNESSAAQVWAPIQTYFEELLV